MVSKVAVMALVAVLAVPILLGYGLSLDEESITEYKLTGTKTNVTELLKNGVGYTYSHGDSYKLNTDFSIKHLSNEAAASPIYESYTTSYSSLPMEINKFNNVSSGATQGVNHPFFYEQFDYDPSIGYTTATINAYINGSTQTLMTVPNFHSIYYTNSTQEYEITAYTPYSGNYTYQVYTGNADLRNFSYSSMTGGSFSGYREITRDSTNTYVDISKGFHFPSTNYINGKGYEINLPTNTKSIVFTVNLDSVSESNYKMSFGLEGVSTPILIKETTNGVVHWWRGGGTINASFKIQELYYDPSRSDNTYQVIFELNKTRQDQSYSYYEIKTTYNYVGGWPKVLGLVNYYKTYTTTGNTFSVDPDLNLDNLKIQTNGSNTLTMRVDDALFRSFEYPVIENQNYKPADFGSNPQTLINNVTEAGYSLQFGSETYVVDSDGNITLGTHKASVNGLIFESVRNGITYDNKVNGYVVSTSADPAEITFNGRWGANVTTQSMEISSYTKTEWIPGEFAWDGIDQNFLMVGLITCLGVFIALGIYLRKTKSSMWPLLIVCGCAAGLFICMI